MHLYGDALDPQTRAITAGHFEKKLLALIWICVKPSNKGNASWAVQEKTTCKFQIDVADKLFDPDQLNFDTKNVKHNTSEKKSFQIIKTISVPVA